MHHFAEARSVEVLVLQASPFLGFILANVGGEHVEFAKLALLLIGSLALTAHVFVFNDWAGQNSDVNDPRRATRVFGRRGIESCRVVRLAVALLVVAIAALAPLGASVVLISTGIAALSVVYSWPSLGKETPIIASAIHLFGGALHFLLGYAVAQPVDARGVAISLFFGLVFAGGHLNQEVRDHDSDLRNGIRTNAVVFGSRPTFLASLVVFTAAYATLVSLAVFAILPRPLVWGALLWPVHAAWSAQALRSGMRFETAHWMQRRYRVLFAVLGLAMLVTGSPMGAQARPALESSRRVSGS